MVIFPFVTALSSMEKCSHSLYKAYFGKSEKKKHSIADYTLQVNHNSYVVESHYNEYQGTGKRIS